MKLRQWSLVIACGAIVTCSDIDNFQIEEKAAAQIPGSPLGTVLGAVGFPGFTSFDLTQSSELANQGVTKNQIDSVRLTQLTLTVVEPQGEGLEFMDSLRFFVEAPGLPHALIAGGGPFAAGARTADLRIEDVELKPYATAASMTITTDSSGRSPREETTVEAAILLDVDVNVGGAICGG